MDTATNNPKNHPAQESDEMDVTRERDPFFIVGIGASAGGLDSLEKFFKNMMDKSGMAFVVVQHLSPDYKSLMVELLSKHSKMKIHRAENNVEVLPDNVYLIPPKKNLTIYKGKLLLMEQEQHGLNLPIDIFLKSLAEDNEEHAIGIILSGTGSDGSRGIRTIKEKGGVILVQDSVSAKFDGMPSSAISTGLVDYILPPEKMPQTLLQYIKHPFSSGKGEKPIISPKKDDYTNNLFMLLKERTGIDFSLYKLTTVSRRIERRMSINQIGSLENYANFIKDSPQELNALHRELLIGVTSFFRDTEVFDIIEDQVIPTILNDKPYNGSIRFWSVGCSTGEEAYSLAMLLKKYMENIDKQYDVKIFATDVDRHAIAVASEGIYTQSIVADVPPEMINRYFTKMGNRFQVSKEIREMVIFAVHNAIKDPPFNKIDLVSCRNFLIYLNPDAQKKVLSFFQFSLNANGYMLLGSSETVGDMITHFKSIDHRCKIFRYLSDDKPSHIQGLGGVPNLFSRNRVQREDPPFKMRQKIIEDVKDAMIDLYSPPAIAITEDNKPLIVFGDINRFLKIPKGEFNFDLISLLRKDLSTTVSLAIHKAARDNEGVVYNNIKVKDGEETRIFNLKVLPLKKNRYQQRLTLITFEEVIEDAFPSQAARPYDLSMDSEERIQDLDQELQYTRENLQATIEELETTNEELQATNEELMSSNEELQSTNEELQSVNEELITVNAEYQAKIQELIELNDDMDNLLASTDIGTIFLDKDLLVRKFTPAITRTVNLMEMDLGRPINHITHKIINEDFIADVNRVLKTLVPIEKEVQGQEMEWFLLRINPYRTKDNYIKGIVITFIDVTDKIKTQKSFQESENLYRGFFENIPHEIAYHRILLDQEGNPEDVVCIDVNERFQKLFNVKKEMVAGKKMSEMKPVLKEMKIPWLETFGKVALDAEPVTLETYMEELDRWYKVTVFSTRQRHFISFFEDITDQKREKTHWEKRYRDLEKRVGGALNRLESMAPKHPELEGVLQMLRAERKDPFE